MCIINVNTTEKLILYLISNINLDTRFIKSIIKITIVNLFKIFLITLSKYSQFLLFFGLSPMVFKSSLIF